MESLLFLFVFLYPTNIVFKCEAVANVSRAHYYLYPDKVEPTHVDWSTLESASGGSTVGWSSSASSDFGWTTISPTNAGWHQSTTTDYGWATATPTPAQWSSPTPAPPPPPSNNGWGTPASPPSNGWSAPTPPPPQHSGWVTSSGWSPASPPPPSNQVWSPSPFAPPTQGWMTPGGCTTADCVALENYLITNILNNSNYHSQLRPPPYDNPTLVNVDVFVKNILFVNDINKTWKVQLTLRQQWNDPRLAYSTHGCPSYKHFTLTSTDGLWTPDLFFPLEEEATYHQVPQRNILVWIAPNGDVTYSTRITVTMNCRGKKTPTELICPLIIGSYAYSSDKIRLQWLAPDPVQIDLNRISLPNYTVSKVATSGSGDPSTYLGQFPGVVAKFIFAKKQNECSFGW